MQYKCMACSAKCSMFSMKFTDVDSGAFAGAGKVVMYTVKGAVCSVLPAKDGNQAVETG